jgi:transcriptional regulator with XRE-family HTH domain
VSRPLVTRDRNLAIGCAIAAARLRRGLTLRELAARGGLSAAAICRYESAERAPGWHELAAIARGLGVRMSTLVAAAEELE